LCLRKICANFVQARRPALHLLACTLTLADEECALDQIVPAKCAGRFVWTQSTSPAIQWRFVAVALSFECINNRSIEMKGRVGGFFHRSGSPRQLAGKK
jgi:hypothetical protein